VSQIFLHCDWLWICGRPDSASGLETDDKLWTLDQGRKQNVPVFFSYKIRRHVNLFFLTKPRISQPPAYVSYVVAAKCIQYIRMAWVSIPSRFFSVHEDKYSATIQNAVDTVSTAMGIFRGIPASWYQNFWNTFGDNSFKIIPPKINKKLRVKWSNNSLNAQLFPIMTYTWVDVRFPLYWKPQNSRYAIDREVTRYDFQYRTFFHIYRTSSPFNISCIQIIFQNLLLNNCVLNFQNSTRSPPPVKSDEREHRNNAIALSPLIAATVLKSDISAPQKHFCSILTL
jgi:hypothetical protein